MSTVEPDRSMVWLVTDFEAQLCHCLHLSREGSINWMILLQEAVVKRRMYWLMLRPWDLSHELYVNLWGEMGHGKADSEDICCSWMIYAPKRGGQELDGAAGWDWRETLLALKSRCNVYGSRMKLHHRPCFDGMVWLPRRQSLHLIMPWKYAQSDIAYECCDNGECSDSNQ